MRSRTDRLRALTLELDRVLNEAGLVPRPVREDLVARLDELRPWGNALCSADWLGIAEDGSTLLEHLYRDDDLPVAFEWYLVVERLSDVRTHIADISIRIAEAVSVASPAHAHVGGTGYALATVMPRMSAPPSAPPEPDLLHAARRAVRRDDALSRETLTRDLATLGNGTAPTERE